MQIEYEHFRCSQPIIHFCYANSDWARRDEDEENTRNTQNDEENEQKLRWDWDEMLEECFEQISLPATYFDVFFVYLV